MAKKVADKRSLAFSDVRATEEPHSMTRNYFLTILPSAVGPAAGRWQRNAALLADHASGKLALSEVYRGIDSPAAHNPPV